MKLQQDEEYILQEQKSGMELKTKEEQEAENATQIISAPTKKTRLTHLLLNWKFIALLGAIIVVLIILIPVLLLVDLRRHHHSSAGPSNASEAARYAVVPHNFPDPTVIEVDNTYYGFATRNPVNLSVHIQVAQSKPGIIASWQLLDGFDALPTLPAWVTNHTDAAIWAPQVQQREDGSFIMTYAALSREHARKHCLGLATSNNVTGPYVPTSDEPFVCHWSLGGIIDPGFIVDPITNTSYIYYKNDGNAIGSGGACANGNWPNTPTTFQYDVMDSNFTTMEISPFTPYKNSTQAINTIDNATIFMHNTRIDGSNIESPFLLYREYKHPDTSEVKKAYHLLYNSGCFTDSSYRIQHIPCWLDGNITDFTQCPWQQLKDTQAKTILGSATYVQPNGAKPALLWAPGGPAATQDGQYMVFHADIVSHWEDPAMKRGKHDLESHEHRKRDNGTDSVDLGPSRDSLKKRVRALFVAEMEYDYDWTQKSTVVQRGLKVQKLVLPES